MLDLLVVFYVYYMILNSCLLVLYVLLVVCLFVFNIFFCCDVAGKRWRGGGPKHLFRFLCELPNKYANSIRRGSPTTEHCLPKQMMRWLWCWVDWLDRMKSLAGIRYTAPCQIYGSVSDVSSLCGLPQDLV